VDRIRAALPALRASISPAIQLSVVLDRTTTIRQSVHDVEMALALSVCLVILVVFVFLKDVRTTIIPSVAVPVSLIGTFSVMYFAGYSEKDANPDGPHPKNLKLESQLCKDRR